MNLPSKLDEEVYKPGHEEYRLHDLDLTEEEFEAFINQFTEEEDILKVEWIHVEESERITKISKSLLKFKNLYLIQFYYCSIEYIPEWIHKLEKLTTIGLAGNEIEEIPNEISKCDNKASSRGCIADFHKSSE